MTTLTESEFCDLLKQKAARRGQQKLIAIDAGLSSAFVSMAASGRRKPCDAIARALGYRRIVMFEKVT